MSKYTFRYKRYWTQVGGRKKVEDGKRESRTWMEVLCLSVDRVIGDRLPRKGTLCRDLHEAGARA